jgi:hypothetical protein
MRRKSFAFTVVLLGLLLLLLVGAAFASTKAIRDASGDSKPGAADIKAAEGISRAHSVTWRITTYNNFSTNAAPCVGVGDTPTRHPLGDHFNICGDGVIQDFKHGGTAGHVKVKRPDRSVIVYTIRRRKLGHVKAIAWSVAARVGKRCFPDLCDQAPEGPGTHVVQKL